jgi:phosphoribosylformylglycinamidine synthase
VRLTVLIRPKAGILDPQGEAVQASLATLGFSVTRARVGRLVDLEASADDPEAAREEVERMCAELLGAESIAVWHTELTLPPGTGGVVLPGGFSYGDYLRCGAIARFAPVMDAVRRFAAGGGPVLGICNGFQILCEAGLLPGVLRANRQLEFLCADVRLTVESTATPFTGDATLGEELVIPVKHGEGCWAADDALFAGVVERGQVVLRYADEVNGARDRVAGVANEAGNILGLMPHPEHAVDPLLGPTGGIPILEGLIAAARRRAPLGASA